MIQKEQENTGTKDVTYNLISVAYHALQGAENYGIYADDATQSGDKELAQFFKEMQDQERRRAQRAKELLGKRLKAE